MEIKEEKRRKTDNNKISWIAENLEDIKKITMSIIFIAGLGYATIDWLSTKFVTKLEAMQYALKKNVNRIDDDLAKTQLLVYQNELMNARKMGIHEEDKDYYRAIHKRIFLLKIKLKMIDAKPEDYRLPKYLQ